jgi:hypothetical protein
MIVGFVNKGFKMCIWNEIITSEGTVHCNNVTPRSKLAMFLLI